MSLYLQKDQHLKRQQLQIIAFLLVMLSGIQLGANNHEGYRTGERTLNNKYDFCRYQNKSFEDQILFPAIDENVMTSKARDRQLGDFNRIRLTQQNLLPYLNVSVEFHSVPKTWDNFITTKLIQLQYQRGQFESQISSIRRSIASEEKSSNTVDPYSVWKLEDQLPLQIKSIEDELRVVNYQIRKLETKTFSGSFLFELALEMEAENKLPTLGLEVIREISTLKDEYAVYPTWKTNSGWQRASHNPWLRVSSEFLDEETKKDLSSKRIPHLLARYTTAAKHFVPTEKSPIPHFQWLSPSHFVLTGNEASGILPTTKSIPMTFPTDLGVLSIFDFACIQGPKTAMARAIF